MRGYRAAWIFVVLGGCSTPSPVQKQETKQAPRPLPADESRWFPLKDRVSTRVVADHLFGPALIPGGTLGEYGNGKISYQLGLTRMSSRDKAAFFLLDVKKAMSDPQYLAHMGGYFGMSGNTPLYVFAKGPYVASVQGLPMDKADPVARTFAARIP